MNIEPVLTEVRNALLAAWPDVDTGGVWLVDQSSTSPYELKTLPFAVAAIDQMTIPDNGMIPVSYPTFQIPVRATYVAVCDGSAIALRGKAMDLVDLLYTDPFTACRFAGVQRVHWGGDLEANRQFLSKQMPQRAISIEFTVEAS